MLFASEARIVSWGRSIWKALRAVSGIERPYSLSREAHHMAYFFTAAEY
jgi:hypothetical protein